MTLLSYEHPLQIQPLHSISFLCRHAYAYAVKLEQQTRLLRDFTEIFRPDLAALRAKYLNITLTICWSNPILKLIYYEITNSYSLYNRQWNV